MQDLASQPEPTDSFEAVPKIKLGVTKNGKRLNTNALTPELQDSFAQKQLELETKYPGLFDPNLPKDKRQALLKRIERDNLNTSDPTCIAFLFLLLVCTIALGSYLYSTHGINMFTIIDEFLMKKLDPKIPNLKTEL